MKIYILFFIILFTCFTFYQYVYQPYYNIENYKNSIFISKGLGCQIIKKFHTNYFLKMEKKESKIRGCYKLKCPNYYCKNILSFSKMEKKSMLWLLSIVKKFIDKTIPSWKNYPWNFIKVSKKIEGGMPHTINLLIVIPESISSSISFLYKKKKFTELIEEYGLIFIHEYIHVIQKLNPNIFNNLYQNYWRYSYKKVNIPPLLLEKQRINPDGLDTNWVFNKKDKSQIAHHVVLKKNTNQLDHIDIVTLNVKQDDTLNKVKSDNEFKSFFCNNSQNYHPHENSASLISEYILFKNGYNINFNNNCKAIKQMEKWILSI
jgi:hypothetical protein